MTALEKIQKVFSKKSAGTIIHKGVQWFVAKDVCEALGIAIDEHTFDDFPAKEKGEYKICTPGVKRQVLFVNKAGLYRLIFKSDLPEAETFKTWIFEEILPRRLKEYEHE